MMRKVMLGCGLALMVGTFSQGAVAMMTDGDEGVSVPVYRLNPAEEEIARERARFHQNLHNANALEGFIDEVAAYPQTSPVRDIMLREIMNRSETYLFLSVRAAIALPQDDAERNAFLAEKASWPGVSFELRSQAILALPDEAQRRALWGKLYGERSNEEIFERIERPTLSGYSLETKMKF